MIRPINRNAAASIALCAALACGSPALFAQDAVVIPTVQSAPVVEASPAPAAEVMPPPVVRTIPDEMLDQPVAVPVAEKAAPRRAAAKAAPVKAASAPRAAAVPATDIVEIAPSVAEPAVATVEDTAPITPIEPIAQPPAEQVADDANEDWMLYGGLAAALGLAGLGAAVAARRRRGRVGPNSPAVQTAPVAAPDYPAARRLTATGPVAAPRTIPSSFATQPRPPVTDPLFAHQATPAPVTDPLFSHKAVALPITDPLFADHPRYVGTSSSKADERPTVRELEPAE
ncbi:MAG: hypothetical protein ABI668_15190 [Sphingorhabdus sp.]